MFAPGGGGGVRDEGEPCEASLEGQGEVSQGVNGEVVSFWRRGSFRPPVKWEVDRGEAFHAVPGRVLGLEGREGGEGLWDSGCGWVGLRGGAGNSEGG